MPVNIVLWGYLKGQSDPAFKEKSKLEIPPDTFDNISIVSLPKCALIYFFWT